MIIWKWYGYIVLVILAVFIILGDLIWLWHFIKCFKIKECTDRKCKMHGYCPKYKEVITKEDRNRLEELIDRL